MCLKASISYSFHMLHLTEVQSECQQGSRKSYTYIYISYYISKKCWRLKSMPQWVTEPRQIQYSKGSL